MMNYNNTLNFNDLVSIEQTKITIDPDNMKILDEIWGEKTDACKHRVVNDLIREAVNKGSGIR